jgi:Sulfatase
MISKLDESVGKVVKSLKKTGMLENSILMFYSDNGAPTAGLFQNSGSNYPLRGVRSYRIKIKSIINCNFLAKTVSLGRCKPKSWIHL